MGKTLNFLRGELFAEDGMMATDDWFTGLFLFVLRLVVYTGSSFLAKVVLSLYGLIHSLAVLPGNRVSAAKSLLRYGVVVIQKRLGSEDAL